MNSYNLKRICTFSLALSALLFGTPRVQAAMITITTADGDGADAPIRGLIGSDDQSGDNFGGFSNLLTGLRGLVRPESIAFKSRCCDLTCPTISTRSRARRCVSTAPRAVPKTTTCKGSAS